MSEENDFNTTVAWAVEEEKIRQTRGQGVGSFYLILVSVVILFLCFLFLYYNGPKSDLKSDLFALDMMKDPTNIFDDEFSGAEEEYAEPVQEIQPEEYVSDPTKEVPMPPALPPIGV